MGKIGKKTKRGKEEITDFFSICDLEGGMR